MSDSSPLPSALLNNRYHVLGLLGEGGFGRTFLVEDRQMPSARRCVVKQLKPVADNPQLHQIVQERFQREAAILEQLGEHHSQIPRLYAYFSEGDLFYLVEEWVEGDTLTQKVYKEGALSEATVRDILLQLLPAIADIHRQQMIHRDIKPDNVILRQRDSKPVLIDFGAVKETMSTIINSQGNSSHSIVVGTPGFMPSEQLAGRPVYASDLYSLGLTAIYLLTRKLPQEFATHPLSGELIWQPDAPAVSPEFAGILNRSIHLHLSQRFPTAEAMLHALTAIATPPAPSFQAPPTVVTQQPIYAPPPTPAPQPMPTMPSYPPVQTQAIAPAHPVSTQSIPATGSGDWKKAVIIGGLVGVSILGGALLLKGQIGTPDAPKTAQSPTADPATTSASPTPSQTPASRPSPIASSDPQPSATPSPAASPAVPALSPVQNANASIVGESGVKNIRSAPNTAANVVYTAAPGDRVRIIGSRTSEGYPWYNIALPNGDDGWIAGQLVRPDAETASPSPTPQPSTSTTNAAIVGQSGSKNIRTGPGTNYETQHIAYPGDRVRILDSARDSGGFLWYRVYFPNSGADGWIAAQLIRRD